MCLFFEKKRQSYTRCKGVPGAMCCGKLYDSLRFGGILDPRVLCGQLCAFISISALTVFSQWSFGPYGQASSRSRPNDGRNESFPCVHVWSGLCIACPYPCCWFCFDGSMRYVATRDQRRHWFLMCLFCQLLSDRVASVVKTKSVLIGFSLNRLNRMK